MDIKAIEFNINSFFGQNEETDTDYKLYEYKDMYEFIMNYVFDECDDYKIVKVFNDLNKFVESEKDDDKKKIIYRQFLRNCRLSELY